MKGYQNTWVTTVTSPIRTNQVRVDIKVVAIESYSKKKQLSDTNNSLWDRTTTSLHNKDHPKQVSDKAERMNELMNANILQLNESIDSYDSII
jgi:hypothetical protein